MMKCIFSHERLSIQFFRYLVVGGCAACIQFVTVWIALNLLGLVYQVAVSLGYTISVFFHFSMNHIFTFHADKSAWAGQLVRYSGLVMINYFITLLATLIMVEILRFSVYLGVATGIAATVVSGFFVAKYWVFTQKVNQIE